MPDDLDQKVFKDYRKGYSEADIAEKHGVSPRKVAQIVRFESVVHARIKQELNKIQATTVKPAKNMAKAKRLK